MARVDELLREGRERLAPVSETAQLDAELLLGRALWCNRTWLYTWPEYEPDEDSEAHFRQMLGRRAAGVPVAYLLGMREFFGHRFRVTPDTLIPRPDTERLVEVALELLPENEQRVADLGTGCGAVGISLALERRSWHVIIADVHANALAVAEENTRRLVARNVETVNSDWLDQVPTPLDAVISNPPYVPETDRHLTEGDLRFEPTDALAAGPDGLDAIRTIIARAPERLEGEGWLVLEHGADQGEAVRTLMRDAGFEAVATERDLSGHERVTHGRLDVQR